MLTGGLKFVMKQIANAADQENVETPDELRERLLRAQMSLELGEIDDARFAEIEADVLAKLRGARGASPASGPISFTAGDGADIRIGFSEEEERDV